VNEHAVPPEIAEPVLERTTPRSVAFTIAATLAWPAAAAVSLGVAAGPHAVTSGGLALLASGTMAAYGLDRLVDHGGVDSPPLRRALAGATGLAALATAILACTAMWRLAICALLATMSGAYLPLKRVIPKNVLTVTAWTVAVTHLPFSGLGGRPADVLAVGAIVALLVIANTVLCDIPDIASDLGARVVAITPRVGARTAAFVAGSAAATGACVSGLTGHWGLAVAALCLVAVAFFAPKFQRSGRLKQAADAAVIFVPGPLELLMSV
jgi:hypothetical protein